ncbi:MAG: hypothetical protein D6784_06140, partial [Chloroflexi bacterium]
MLSRFPRWFVFVLTVLLLTGCRKGVQAPLAVNTDTPPSRGFTPTGTFVPPVPVQTSPVKIPMSIRIIGSPTPGETAQEQKEKKYPGFSTVVTLPDDILMPGEVNETDNMIDSLAFFIWGGGGDECREPTLSLFYDGHVSGCGFASPENIIIELLRPDNSVVVARLRSDSFSYCFDNSLMLQPGRYTLRVTTESLPIETHSFDVSHAAQPRIFLSNCRNTIVEKQPVQIFFDGFQPDERLVVALYFENYDTWSYEIIRTWPAQVDSSGRLVQEIAAPQVKETGGYGIAVFGQTTREVQFGPVGASDAFMASAATIVRVVKESEASPNVEIVSATITPRPDITALAPSSFCKNAPAARVEVGDSIRVTYT